MLTISVNDIVNSCRRNCSNFSRKLFAAIATIDHSFVRAVLDTSCFNAVFLHCCFRGMIFFWNDYSFSSRKLFAAIATIDHSFVRTFRCTGSFNTSFLDCLTTYMFGGNRYSSGNTFVIHCDVIRAGIFHFFYIGKRNYRR